MFEPAEKELWVGIAASDAEPPTTAVVEFIGKRVGGMTPVGRTEVEQFACDKVARK